MYKFLSYFVSTLNCAQVVVIIDITLQIFDKKISHNIFEKKTLKYNLLNSPSELI